MGHLDTEEPLAPALPPVADQRITPTRYPISSRNVGLAMVAVLCLLGFTFGQPQPTLRSILVHGLPPTDAARLLESAGLREAQPCDERRLHDFLDLIARQLRNDGFLFAEARIDSLVWDDDSSGISLYVTAERGARTLVGNLRFEGNVAFDADALRASMKTEEGSAFHPSQLMEDLDALIRLYENNGYPFASAGVKEATRDQLGESELVNLLVGIEEGQVVRIDSVQFAGLKETKPWVVLRETGITSGELFDARKIVRVKESLSRMNLFRRVDDPSLLLRGGTGILEIGLEEGTQNSFDALLGYVPGSPGGEPGYLTGLASIAMRNLFGTGRRLDARWERESRATQDLELGYVEPWMFGYPFDVRLRFQQRQQDSLFVKRSVQSGVSYRYSQSVALGVVIRGESVIPSEGSAQSILPTSTSWTAGVEVTLDTRDDAVVPERGLEYFTRYEYGEKNTESSSTGPSLSGSNSSLQRVHIDVEGYVPISRRQIIALGFHGRQITTDRLDEADFFRIGGGSTVRGYREGQFRGSRVTWGNAEFRLMMERRSFLFAFVDAGYYFIPSVEIPLRDADQNLLVGYGVGTWFETRMGLIGVSCALGKGDPLGQMKIHIGLRNEF